MGSSLWEKLGLPLLIGVASPILVAALCFLSVRLWNCLMNLIKTRSAAGEGAHDQPLPDIDACCSCANGVPDLEIGNGYGPAQGGESVAEPESELRTVNGDQGTEHLSDQEAHTPVINSLVTGPGHWRCCKSSPSACQKGRSSFPVRGSC